MLAEVVVLLQEKPLDTAVLFHSMLVAYQIALKNILGVGGGAVSTCPVLDNFTKINEATGVHMVSRQSLDEALENLSSLLKASGLVREFGFEKFGERKYIVHVDDCVWAPTVHKKLHTKDLTCPLALMAMSIVQAHSGKKVKVADSEYLEKGTRTRIETEK